MPPHDNASCAFGFIRGAGEESCGKVCDFASERFKELRTHHRGTGFISYHAPHNKFCRKEKQLPFHIAVRDSSLLS